MNGVQAKIGQLDNGRFGIIININGETYYIENMVHGSMVKRYDADTFIRIDLSLFDLDSGGNIIMN